MTATFPDFPGGSTKQEKPVPLAEAVPPPYRGGLYRGSLKRVFDVTAVILSLPVVLPLILVLAACVASDGGRPFYAQARVGKGRRIFRMWKLRSMVVDADARIEECLAANPEARREWDRTQKLKNDPRVTRFGRMLRKSSIDELPQLWNVLKGDMSLVGPRPMMISQQELYPSEVYYALRPGITGYWQVSGRNNTSFAARATYDAAYYADLSLPTDLRILLRTVRTVAHGTGY